VLVGDRRDFCGIRILREAGLAEVRAMDAQDEASPAGFERLAEVLGPGPIGCPDLDESDAGSPDDLRDPNPATDLDELAARHRHAAPPGEADGQRNGGGVVVRDEGVLGAGQGDQVLLGLAEAGAALARRAVELEQQVIAGDLGDGGDGRSRPRGSAEIRMDDDAGRIDRRSDSDRRVRLQLACGIRRELVDRPLSRARLEPGRLSRYGGSRDHQLGRGIRVWRDAT
jgi:hypothetical protein